MPSFGQLMQAHAGATQQRANYETGLRQRKSDRMALQGQQMGLEQQALANQAQQQEFQKSQAIDGILQQGIGPDGFPTGEAISAIAAIDPMASMQIARWSYRAEKCQARPDVTTVRCGVRRYLYHW